MYVGEELRERKWERECRKSRWEKIEKVGERERDKIGKIEEQKREREWKRHIVREMFEGTWKKVEV